MRTIVLAVAGSDDAGMSTADKIKNVLACAPLELDVHIVDTKPCAIENLQESLLLGVVHFVYEKKDGTKRFAFGTMKPELLSAYSQVAKDKKLLATVPALIEAAANNAANMERAIANPALLNDADPFKLGLDVLQQELGNYHTERNKQPAERKASEDTVTYFDLEANDYRSFVKSNFLYII